MDFCGFAIKVMSLRWHWQGRRERAALRNAEKPEEEAVSPKHVERGSVV